MVRKWHSVFASATLALLAGCVEPYAPPDILEAVDILVVDGYINTTQSAATVALSHAIALDSTSAPIPELHASVTIEDDAGKEFPLKESGSGKYTVTETDFDKSRQYRVHIFTTNDEEFVSDYITLLDTPEIDSISWKPDDTGINVFVNTHDPENNSLYYFWTYEETWEYVSSFISNYKMVDGKALDRPYEERIWMCWGSQKNTDIFVATSDKLSADVINEFPLLFVPAESARLSRRYSLLVTQRTLTHEAYEFWSLLQKTSADLGGLFDSQPAQVLGNIHNANADTPVLGYFSGGEVAEKRLFVEFWRLPNHLAALREKNLCDDDDMKSLRLSELPGVPNSVLLVEPIIQRGIGIVGYTWAQSICIDCRLRGGTTVKPDFW